MTNEEAVAVLDAINSGPGHQDGDPESFHERADEILLAVVAPDVAEAYKRLVDRSSWWAHA